jgi:hypothetical protein
MLLELLPHFARLVPMADKYLSGRSGSEEKQQAALAALTDGMHGELGKVTAAHAAVERTLSRQSDQLAEVAVEAKRARMGVESMEARLSKLEAAATAALRLLAVALLMLAGTLVLLAISLSHLSHR